jgi:hypothetical protein
LQDLHLYDLAASLQLSHRHSSIEPQFGQLNFTHLSLGIIGLWHELHTGKAIDDDMLAADFRPNLYLAYQQYLLSSHESS